MTKVIIINIISLILFLIASMLLEPILGIKGIFGLIIFCMAYKLGTMPWGVINDKCKNDRI